MKKEFIDTLSKLSLSDLLNVEANIKKFQEDKLSWKYILNFTEDKPQRAANDLWVASQMATNLGYELFAWNGKVYSCNASGWTATSFTTDQIK